MCAAETHWRVVREFYTLFIIARGESRHVISFNNFYQDSCVKLLYRIGVTFSNDPMKFSRKNTNIINPLRDSPRTLCQSEDDCGSKKPRRPAVLLDDWPRCFESLPERKTLEILMDFCRPHQSRPMRNQAGSTASAQEQH